MMPPEPPRWLVRHYPVPPALLGWLVYVQTTPVAEQIAAEKARRA